MDFFVQAEDHSSLGDDQPLNFRQYRRIPHVDSLGPLLQSKDSSTDMTRRMDGNFSRIQRHSDGTGDDSKCWQIQRHQQSPVDLRK
uniref:Uncharacterized protein n=1 Tax=Globodera rostochiensis TaxID=31243 RepID=A0A914H103_GLORO